MRERLKSKRQRIVLIFSLWFIACGLWSFPCFAQDENLISTIKFKDADIKVVIQAIAQKAIRNNLKINIVISPSVEGLVSVNLENVDWLSTLEAVLRPYDYSYEWIGESILLVDTIEKISEREVLAKEREGVEPAQTKVFKLKFIDANDAKKTIEPMLSPIGRVSVLELTGQAGWDFGTDVTKRSRSEDSKISRTKTLIVSDISKKLDEIGALVEKIDIMPKQILIKTRVMEVNRDTLEDFGFDWGTGTNGASSTDLSFVDANLAETKLLAGKMLTDQNTPSVFGAKTTGLSSANTGLRLAFRKLTGLQFEAIVHALEEDTRTNTLSAPIILTLDNQEASILVGEKYPIVKTEVSTETNQITGGSLDYYQDIGIQVNVVPQICGENDEFISMIIHPAVTSQSGTITVQNDTTILVTYPQLTSRETETQVIMKDGETIVIGGLFKDVKSAQEIGIPILKELPLIGRLFKRRTEDIEKIDLMIFITAKIVKPGALFPLDIIDPGQFSAKFKEFK